MRWLSQTLYEAQARHVPGDNIDSELSEDWAANEVHTLRASQLSSRSSMSSSADWKVGLVLLIFLRGPPPKPSLLARKGRLLKA